MLILFDGAVFRVQICAIPPSNAASKRSYIRYRSYVTFFPYDNFWNNIRRSTAPCWVIECGLDSLSPEGLDLGHSMMHCLSINIERAPHIYRDTVRTTSIGNQSCSACCEHQQPLQRISLGNMWFCYYWRRRFLICSRLLAADRLLIIRFRRVIDV